MLKKTYSLLLILLFISGCASSVDPSLSDRHYKADFSHAEITLMDDAIPFNNYTQWLEDTKSKNPRGVDGFQRSLDPAEFARFKNSVESKWMAYQSEGLKISGVVAYPKNWSGEKLPVVIFNRGGHNFGGKTLGGNSRLSLYKLILPLAEQGYIVLASNYRGSKFSQGKDEFGGNDVNDVLRLIDIVDSISFADNTRIAMVGWSRGAMMTLLAARQTSRLKTAAVVAGNVDMFASLKHRPNMEKVLVRLVPDFDKNRHKALEERSAIFWLDELNPKMPLLIMHGTADWRVAYQQSEMLADKLNVLGHPHQFRRFKDGDHGLTFYKQEWQNSLFIWLKDTL